MKINAFERLFVNNPIRQYQIRKNLQHLKSLVPGEDLSDVLEIGCGFGAGIIGIEKVLAPKTISAFDLDETMVEAARQRTKHLATDIAIQVSDAESIPFPDASFDCVCEFTIFHHIPNWEKAIAETARVLRPGGVFFFEELAREFHFDSFFISSIQQRFTVHPWETIPDKATFLKALEDAGLKVVFCQQTFVQGWLLGAAKKAGA